MAKGTIEGNRSLQFGDLKEIALEKGPCLTITLPIAASDNVSEQDSRRLKSALQSAESLLAGHGWKALKIREFLDPIRQMESSSWGAQGGSLVVLRSSEHFQYFRIHGQLSDSVTLAEHFQVLPYLRTLQEEQRHFYVLALSQNHVRLLRCTNHSSEDVPLPPKTPSSIEEWLNTRTPTSSPDRGQNKAREAGASEGTFTSTHDRDRFDPHIANFFHQVSAGVSQVLRNEIAPLILVGVDFEISMYRNINSYPHLAAEHVEGSPESLKGGEMHARALRAADKAFEEPMKKALELYERFAGSERVAGEPANVVKVAAEGRVAHLFVEEGARQLGHWDNNTFRATTEGEGEDLINIATLQTLAHGGEVWVTSRDKVPNGHSVAALLRF